MTEQEFIEQFTELLDTEQELSLDTMLNGIDEWDSLSHVAFMAFCMTAAKGDVTSVMVKEAKSVGDLYRLVTA